MVVILSLTACSHLDEPVPNTVLTTGETLTKLGEKLEIPFTVENMQTAYDNLAENESVTSQGRIASGMDANLKVEASHYYYRFLPKDSLEYEMLVQDTVMDVSDVPFEYEIDSMASYYQDPSLIRSSDFTWYYSVLPVDYTFPQTVEHEKLEELYFPPEFIDEDDLTDPTSRRTATLGEYFYDIWEAEALRITDNLDEEDLTSLVFSNDGMVNYPPISNGRTQGSKWRPKGTITAEEGVLTDIGSSGNIVGVAGAEIKIRKWGLLVIEKTRTDRNGYYSARKIHTKYVRYAIYFNNSDFKVKAGTVFWDAYYRSSTKYKRKGWSRTFFEGGQAHFYSLVQNAAYDYYKNVISIYRLKKPRYVKISAKYSACKSSQHRSEIATLLPVSEIRVTRKNTNCNYRQTDGIYATTVHELAHASHRELDKGIWSPFTFSNCSKTLLRESWAEGVETIVTSDRYWSLDSRYEASNGNATLRRAGLSLWNDWRQDQTVNEMNEYTPIVADLYDYINQNARAGLSGTQPVDRVSGYKLNEIQAALKDCRDIDCWEKNLRNKFQKNTEGNLTELFDYVRVVRRDNLESPCN